MYSSAGEGRFLKRRRGAFAEWRGLPVSGARKLRGSPQTAPQPANCAAARKPRGSPQTARQPANRAAAWKPLVAHDFREANEEKVVSAFLRHAEEIFAVARQGGGEDCEMAILVAGDGGIHVVTGAGWGLEPLRLHHGARAAYRVTRAAGQVRLEARSAGECCLLESSERGMPLRAPIPDYPQYLTIA